MIRNKIKHGRIIRQDTEQMKRQVKFHFEIILHNEAIKFTRVWSEYIVTNTQEDHLIQGANSENRTIFARRSLVSSWKQHLHNNRIIK
jgi:hypothetical protein